MVRQPLPGRTPSLATGEIPYRRCAAQHGRSTRAGGPPVGRNRGGIMIIRIRMLAAGAGVAAALAVALATPALAEPTHGGADVANPPGGTSTLQLDDTVARKNDKPAGSDKPHSKKELCGALVGTLNSDLQQLAWANASGDQETISFWRDQVAKDFAAGGYMGCSWAA